MALLDGRWRLLFSSGFTSGSLGGRRPGPSFGSLPLTLGPVYQDIYTGAWGTREVCRQSPCVLLPVQRQPACGGRPNMTLLCCLHGLWLSHEAPQPTGH